MNENVRKVFDMLGVEPNERFKVEDFEETYFIDERLYVRKSDKTLSNYLTSRDFLTGEATIIKLPKEPNKIKKKLRYLTPEEWDKWIRRNCTYPCEGCIFRNVVCSNYTHQDSWLNHKDLYSDKFLDQEIEVEE